MAPHASSAPDAHRPVAALTQIVLLALWIGAAAFFAAVVAPASFAVLPTRELAGALVGRALPVLFLLGITTGLLVLAVEGGGVGRRRRTARRIAAAAIAVACAVAQFGIAPRIAAIRERLTTPLASLPTDDPQRVAFGRLHMQSVAWLGVAMLAGGVGLVLAAQTLRRRAPA